MAPCILHCKLHSIACVSGFSTAKETLIISQMSIWTRIDSSLGLPANIHLLGMYMPLYSAPHFVSLLTPVPGLSRVSIHSKSFPNLLRQIYDLPHALLTIWAHLYFFPDHFMYVCSHICFPSTATS